MGPMMVGEVVVFFCDYMLLQRKCISVLPLLEHCVSCLLISLSMLDCGQCHFTCTPATKQLLC